MKDIKLLIWLTQLGLSVAVPPVLMILLALWLQNSCGLGNWVVWTGVVIGISMAIDGLRTSLKVMQRLIPPNQNKEPPPVSFNDHD